MAGFFQQLLQGTKDGFLESPYLKDYKHASKTFITNAYGNAPKFKYLFHVYFDINKTLIGDSLKLFPDTTNHGLLVKTIDLPKFSIPLTEYNQYNRKRYVQTKISYDPVRISFHDDNLNQIRNLWFAYYSYYYNDPNQPGGLDSGPTSPTFPDEASSELNRRNIYSAALPTSQLNWGYSGEIGGTTMASILNSKYSFFKSIKIFGFNQHNYVLYQLINPMIENFSHDSYNYSEGNGTMESTMSVKYETVKYFEGALNGQEPGKFVDRFAEPGVYDTDLSPIARNGSNRNILGKGGLVDGASGIINDLSSGNILGAMQTAGRLSQTFKNPQQILKTAQTELLAGVTAAVANPNTVRSNFFIPSLGTTTGANAQSGNATNARRIAPAPISTPSNTQIVGTNNTTEPI
jgi:hypothetical protein